MEEAAVEFVVKLNQHKIKKEFGSDDSVDCDVDKWGTHNTRLKNKETSKAKISPYQDDYLNELLDMDPEEIYEEETHSEQSLNDATNEFKSRVEVEMKQYVAYCATVDWKDMITTCPTEKYKKLIKITEIDEILIKKKNP